MTPAELDVTKPSAFLQFFGSPGSEFILQEEPGSHHSFPSHPVPPSPWAREDGPKQMARSELNNVGLKILKFWKAEKQMDLQQSQYFPHHLHLCT